MSEKSTVSDQTDLYSETTGSEDSFHVAADDQQNMLYQLACLNKSQTIIFELIQHELDILCETIEKGTYEITSNFQKLIQCFDNDSSKTESMLQAKESLARIVQSLQYQDLANQQIENISNTLTTVSKTLITQLEETHFPTSTSDKALVPDQNYLTQIISERTLGEMRERMRHQLMKISDIELETATTDQNNDDTSIELF